MHIWIIMDWNRRWAKERLLPTFAWHKAWATNIKNVLKEAKKRQISHVTLWWLSDDNIKNRSEEELKYLFELLWKIWDFYDDMKIDDCRFEYIWNTDLLPKELVKNLEILKERTSNFKSITFTLAVWYGWKDEIIRWIKKFISSWWDTEKLNNENFREYLDISKLPLVDIIIRTGWDKRTSWFLLYDSPYSELYFTDVKWPDFSWKDLDDVIDFLSKAKRNFWK